jgi:LysR family glycine cleavage system transcriptional activator
LFVWLAHVQYPFVQDSNENLVVDGVMLKMVNPHLETQHRLPPLNALRAFEAAARLLSFKHAAEELFVTPTAVSHQIKQLEEFVDLTLFNRLTRALELTPEGEAMLPKVRQGLDCFASAIECARQPASKGRLVVVAPPSFARRWLVPRLQRFTQAEPQVNLHLLSSLHAIESYQSGAAQAFAGIDLQADDSQVVIRFGAGTYPGFHVDRIIASDYIAVCSPGLMAAAHPLREPADVRFHVLLHNDTIANERARPSWEEWLRVAGVEGVDSTAGPHFSDSGMALVAAVDGAGIALAPRQLVAGEIEEGKLVSPFDIVIGRHFAYDLVTPTAISSRPAVRAFRQWLLKEARAEELGRSNSR